MKLTRLLFITVFLFSVFTHHAWAGQADTRVAVLPFDMHSDVDISELRRGVMEVMAGTLHDAGAEVVGMELIKGLVLKGGVESFDEGTAIEISKKAGADFAILGSVSSLGAALGADWRIFDIKEGKLLRFYHKDAYSEDELLDGIERTARSMYDRMVAQSEAVPAAGKDTIERIEVVGNRRVDDEAVVKEVVSKVGRPFSPDDVKDDIRRIFGMGYFEGVVVDLSDGASGKVLTFIVEEKPLVKSVTLSGNKEFLDDKINEVLTVKTGTVLDRVIVKEDAERIKLLYEAGGYYLASVKPEVIYEGDRVEAGVVFNIDEGALVKVKRITITGNEVFSDRKLKRLMETKKAGLFSFITGSGTFNEYIFQSDLSKVMKYYFDKGYILADLVDERVLLSEDKKWFYITITLKEGARFRVGDIELTGEILTTREELREALKIESGDVFNRSRFNEGVDAMSFIYGDKGYAYADFDIKTGVNEEDNTVGLTINITRNELVYIERIDIAGNVRTRDKVIRREVEVEEGELYSSTGLKRSRSNLRRLGYFEESEITESEGSDAGKMNVDVKVEERPTGSVSFGMGYSSSDKVVLTAAISQGNLFGTGLKLNLSGTVSAKSSNYVFSFTEPWLFDKPLSAGFNIFDTMREYPDFDTDKQGFGLNFGFPVYKRTTRGFIGYRYERVEISDVSETASPTIKEEEGTSKVSSVRFGIVYDTRDDYFFPNEGSLVNFSTEVAGGAVGGNINFAKYNISALRYFPMPWDTTLALRGAYGYVHSFAGKEVPIYERFFLGGINSLRGFETRSIGPKDPVTGENIGGDTMVVMNTELIFPLFPDYKMKGVVFFDMGNAYDGSVEFGDLRESIGVGVRWFSPIGPIRIEWGYNLDPEDDEKQSIWEFTVGGMF
ncbi:MAG: outer membrane protein assembly factor BamA [Thermodesulfobacteriota bacterium]